MTNVWRWNNGGLGFSSDGYYGTFGTAITQNGAIVADFITTGILNANLIKTGLLQSTNGKTEINMTDGTFNFGDGGMIYDGTNLTLGSGATITSPTITAGTIASSSISAGTITGASISAGTISGVSITGGSITGTLIRTSNTSNFTMLYDQYTSYYHLNSLRLKIGFDTVNNYPSMQLYGLDEQVVGSIVGGGSSASLDGNWTVEAGSGFYMYGSTNLATQSWVSSNYTSYSFVASNYTQFLGDIVYLPNNCYLECLTNRLILHANAGSYLDIRDTGTWVYAKDGTSKQL